METEDQRSLNNLFRIIKSVKWQRWGSNSISKASTLPWSSPCSLPIATYSLGQPGSGKGAGLVVCVVLAWRKRSLFTGYWMEHLAKRCSEIMWPWFRPALMVPESKSCGNRLLSIWRFHSVLTCEVSLCVVEYVSQTLFCMTSVSRHPLRNYTVTFTSV